VEPGRRKIPSWWAVAGADRTNNPDSQRAAGERMGATIVEVPEDRTASRSPNPSRSRRSSRTPIKAVSQPAAVMDAAQPRLIQQFGAGLDGVDIGAAEQRGIPAANVPAAGTGSAAAVAVDRLLPSRRGTENSHRLSSQRSAEREPSLYHADGFQRGARVVAPCLGKPNETP
jgi:lactate dehydrogenase-like 2-hydroxyacid dehydrogenase